MSVFMQPIYSQTLSAPANSITFNNIPQGYTDLMVELSVRTSINSSGFTYMASVNGVGSVFGLYSHTTLRGYAGTGAGASFNATTSQIGYMFMGTINDASSTAGCFTSTKLVIKDYSSGLNKKYMVDSGTAQNSGTVMWQEMIAGSIWTTAPITSIQFNPFNENFVTGTTITLYGISNLYDTAKPAAPTIGAITDQAGFASVAFTANDSGTGQTADSYVVNSTPSGSTTYGSASPIITPAILNTSYTYQVAAVNALGSSSSAATSALTTYNNYASIETISITNTSTSAITFKGIPQNYRHLQIRAILRNSGANTEALSSMVFNGDTSANYSTGYLYGTGASVATAHTASTSFGYFIDGNGSGTLSNVFASGVVDIPDYAVTSKYKTARGLSGWDANGSGFNFLTSSNWRSYAPITSITITCGQGNFAQNSHFALYGLG